MKKLIIAGGALLVIVLIGLLLTHRSATTKQAVSSVQGAADTAAIQALVRDCYQWYAEEYSQLRPPAAARIASDKSLACFSPAFIASWRLNASGVDPVLLSQDYYDSWLSSPPQTSVAFASAIDVTIKTTLGTGTEARTLLVRVLNEAGAWRIAAVRNP